MRSMISSKVNFIPHKLEDFSKKCTTEAPFSYFQTSQHSKNTLTDTADTDGLIASFLPFKDRLNLRLVSGETQRNIDGGDIRKAVKLKSERILSLKNVSDVSFVNYAVTSDEKIVAVDSYRNRMKIFDKMGKLICNVPTGSIGPIITLTQDGKIITKNLDSNNSRLDIWDKSGNLLSSVATGTCKFVVSTTDGKIVTALVGIVKIWDQKTGELLHTLIESKIPIEAITTTQSGEIIAAYYGGTLKIWDQKTGKLLHTLMAHGDRVRNLAAMPNGKFVSTSDTTLKIWDIKTGKLLHSCDTQGEISTGALAVTKNGEIVAGSWCQVKILDQTGDLLHIQPIKSFFKSLTITSDGKIVATSYEVASSEASCEVEVFKIEEKTIEKGKLCSVPIYRQIGSIILGRILGRKS